MAELECLELRQKLKERFRKKMKKELGSGSASSCRSDNFGSFFGPSQPVIAERVIQEMKSLLENPDLAAKVMRKNNIIASVKVHVRPKSSNSDSRSAPKNQSSTVPRQNPSKLQPSISKQKKMMPQESGKPKMIQKAAAMPSSRPPVAMQKQRVHNARQRGDWRIKKKKKKKMEQQQLLV
ncbi:PREDICTED: uncharacterized protein LOC109183786 [Ipomoea nil]|uniref:uncharacterized protein LOC109183786 n=1 Tax=Ipomoea nil TaxID=35883 RepID=UPI0009009AC0|nr:PREDICTED: uncharacterized protein LOC109183786 [Ipomoea nil]